MAKTTFWDIIENTIATIGDPLSPKEIWDKAILTGTIGDFRTLGKTPWATIAAYCYTDMVRNGENSLVVQTSERPTRFFLRRLAINRDFKKSLTSTPTEADSKTKIQSRTFHERDLHAVLVSYAYANTHFKANVKTIYHENSGRNTKGQNEWLHPDLVGVYFPFRDYKAETLNIQNHLSISSIKLFSFELKVNVDFSNLRRVYFQAVSNSSWANEGYLVTLNLDDDLTFLDEIRRLNNAFGIGVIKLNATNIHESEILFPSRINTLIDWDTVNRLSSENSDFNDFLKLISEDCKLGKVKSEYDKVLKLEDISKHILDKGIKNVKN